MNSRRNLIAGVVLALLFVLSMWAYSGPGAGAFSLSWVFALLGWLFLIAAWIVWVVWRSIREQGLNVDFALFAAPLLAAIAVGLIYADIPMKARFAVSQPSMTNAAEFIIEHPTRANDRSRIGTYKAESVEASEKTVEFTAPDEGFLNPVGFIYVRDGDLPNDFSANSIRKMSDHWWIWTQDW